MDKYKYLVFAGLVGVLVIIGLIVLKFFGSKPAGLSIETNIPSTVYLDGKQVGITPFDGNAAAGDGMLLKLVPQEAKYKGYVFETKLNLISGIKTVVRENLGPTDGETSGEVVSLQKSSSDDLAVSVVSNPDAAQITVDGVSKGFTPIRVGNLSNGEHTVLVSLDRYGSRSFLVKTVPGFMVTVLVKLNVVKKEVVVQTVTQKNIQTVKILNTPTGYLRVRSKPTTASDEVGQVHPGETYDFVSKDEKLGWIEIKLSDSTQGWISDDYAAIQNPN